MNKKHICKCCNYATDKLSHYKNHLKSKKHLVNININLEAPIVSQRIPNKSDNIKPLQNKLLCSFCEMSFTRANNRAKHEKTCYHKKIKNKEIEFNEKIKNKEMEFNEKSKNKEIEFIRFKERNNIYERMIGELKKQNERLTTLLSEKASTVNNNTINNVLNYVQKNYKEAYALEPLDDYAHLMLNDGYTHDKEAINILINDGLIKVGEKALILCKVDLKPFVRNLISYKRMNTLHSTIGDFIIRNYVKKDKSKQPIHLTDSSRMKFIYAKLKDSIKDVDSIKNVEKIISWNNDPKGVNIVSIIIDPILKYISHQVRIYQKELAQEFIIDAQNIGVSKINDMEALQSLMNMCLKDNKRNKEYMLRKQIMDYIAPHFQFNKELLLEC